MLIEERRFDARRVRVRTRAIFIKPDGTRAERCNDIRCYTCAELTGMLDQAGLEVQAVFGDFEGGELSLASRRLILVAQKAGAA